MNQTGFVLFLTLLAAHLIGDFLLQTNKDVRTKSSPFVFLKHLLILSSISYLLCGLWNAWLIPLYIFLTHGIIDLIKQIFFTKDYSDNKKLTVFLIDQFFHLASIIFLSAILQQKYLIADLYWFALFNNTFLTIIIIISSVILLTKTGGIIIGYIVNPFLEQMAESDLRENDNAIRGFINGGKVIGYLERILIFIFILSGSLTAVGFLIAAKSVFRFGELWKSAQQNGSRIYNYRYIVQLSDGFIKLAMLQNILLK